MNKLRLTGKKIDLRKHQSSDVNDIFQRINDKNISRWTTRIPYPYKRKHAINFIKEAHKQVKDKVAFPFAMVEKDTNKVIGGITLMDIDWRNKRAELGYWLGKKYWNKGYATEAVRLIIRFGLKKLRLHSIWARVFEQNVASVKVLKRCGFKYDGKKREARFKFKRWHNEFLYSILVGEL